MNFKGSQMKKSINICVATLAFLSLAVAAQAAEGVDSSVYLKDFLYRVFNFTLMIAIIGYFVTKPFRKGMSGRREGIEKALSDAEKMKADAEAKFAEYDRKLQAATDEIDEIYSSIKKEGELERDRIIENANAAASRLKDDAQKCAAEEVRKAKMQLREEASKLAIELAEDLIKKNVTAADQSRLVGEYIKSLGDLR